jgi:hypothetical protein
MKTKLMIAIIGVALVAAALVGVTVQFVGAQNTTNPAPTQAVVPPCANAAGQVPAYCINATTGEPYCYSNGAYAGYCNNGVANGYGYCQSGGCNGYGYGAEMQSQNQYGYGMGCRR